MHLVRVGCIRSLNRPSAMVEPDFVFSCGTQNATVIICRITCNLKRCDVKHMCWFAVILTLVLLVTVG